jgi:hypothetical protein
MHLFEINTSFLFPIVALLSTVPVISTQRLGTPRRDGDRERRRWSWVPSTSGVVAQRRSDLARGTDGGRYLSADALAAVEFTAGRDESTGCLRYQIRNSTPWRIDRAEIRLTVRDASGQTLRCDTIALPLYDAGWPEAQSSNVYPYVQPEAGQKLEVTLLSARVDRRFRPEHAVAIPLRPTDVAMLLPSRGRRAGEQAH